MNAAVAELQSHNAVLRAVIKSTGFQRCAHVTPKHPDLTEFTYVLGGVELNCFIEYEAGCKSTEDDPGDPESAILYFAYVRDVDLAEDVLSDAQKELIEIAFLNQSRWSR